MSTKPVFIALKIVDALEIRDTAEHYSDVVGFEPEKYNSLTIVIENSLDQDITVQVQGALNYDFTIGVCNIGSSKTISANSNDYISVDDYFPFIRVKIIASTTPSAGNVNVYIVKR